MHPVHQIIESHIEITPKIRTRLIHLRLEWSLSLIISMITQISTTKIHLESLRLTGKGESVHDKLAPVLAGWFSAYVKFEVLSSGTHYCAFNRPCSTARLSLSILGTLSTVSKAWAAAFQQALDDKEFFARCEEAYYPHAWHINTRVRKSPIFGQYRVFKTLASENGDRGIYLAYDYSASSGCSAARQVVVKAWTDLNDSACITEDSAYQALTNPAPIYGIPQVLCRGIDIHCGVYAIILEKLGPSLDLLSHVKWSDQTLFAFSKRMLDIYESIHARGIVHNGVKPANICLPSNFDHANPDVSKICIIDFDVSLRVPSSSNLTPGDLALPRTDRMESIGNRTFLSVLSHLGIEQSQRDDLESLAYLLSYLHHGNLPWRGTSSNIWRVKMATPASTLFAGMDGAFVRYWNAVKGLAFGEVPDYAAMKAIFQ